MAVVAGSWWVVESDSVAVGVVVAALVMFKAVRGPSQVWQRIMEVWRARSNVR